MICEKCKNISKNKSGKVVCNIYKSIIADGITRCDFFTEMNNQTTKADAGKEQLRLVPMEIMRNIARIREYGNRKYGDSESWRRVEPERYIDAMLRHAIAFAEDPESVDEESGLKHLHHLACNTAFLCEMYKPVDKDIDPAWGFDRKELGNDKNL